jgi:hypothetical protein
MYSRGIMNMLGLANNCKMKYEDQKSCLVVENKTLVTFSGILQKPEDPN